MPQCAKQDTPAAIGFVRTRIKKGKRFFFEKKNQKTSLTLGHGQDAANALAQSDRVFLLLFLQKKKCFLIQQHTDRNMVRWLGFSPLGLVDRNATEAFGDTR